MVNRYSFNGLDWVDLESPNDKEIRAVMEEFGVHPLVAEELRISSIKPKVDLHNNLLFLILHFPAFRHSHKSDLNQEVDFVIGREFLVTVRYDAVDPIHKFSKEFEVNAVLGRNTDIGTHAGYLFYYLIRKLYKSLSHELEYIESALTDIEDKIFMGLEKEVLEDLSIINRELLDFSQALSAHREVLESFEIAGRKFFGEEFSYHLRAITTEYFKVHSSIVHQKEIVTELRETNDSLLITKQNEAMKVLAIMAFVTFPLSLVASIFGMNTVYLPIVGHPQDFWIVMSIMGTMTVIFFAYFKYKKWL